MALGSNAGPRTYDSAGPEDSHPRGPATHSVTLTSPRLLQMSQDKHRGCPAPRLRIQTTGERETALSLSGIRWLLSGMKVTHGLPLGAHGGRAGVTLGHEPSSRDLTSDGAGAKPQEPRPHPRGGRDQPKVSRKEASPPGPGGVRRAEPRASLSRVGAVATWKGTVPSGPPHSHRHASRGSADPQGEPEATSKLLSSRTAPRSPCTLRTSPTCGGPRRAASGRDVGSRGRGPAAQRRNRLLC